MISRAEDPEWIVEPLKGSREDCVVADLLFIKAPEPKASKNRLHFDLRPDEQSAEVARLERLGLPGSTSAKAPISPGLSWPTPKVTSSASSRPTAHRSAHSGCSDTSRTNPQRTPPSSSRRRLPDLLVHVALTKVAYLRYGEC